MNVLELCVGLLYGLLISPMFEIFLLYCFNGSYTCMVKISSEFHYYLTHYSMYTEYIVMFTQK